MCLELEDDNGTLVDLQSGRQVEFLREWLLFPECEIVINFASSGYHEPASMYGGSDGTGWPAEGDDERLLTKVTIHIDGKDIGTLPKEVSQRLFEMFATKVKAAELDGE